MHARLLRLIAVAALLTGGLARADEGAFGSYVGGGLALRSTPTALTPVGVGDVLLQLTYGMMDRLNWEAATHVSIGRGGVNLFFSSVAEWVAFRSNHLRWNLGLGVALAVPIPLPSVQLGPVLESALRWTVSWGFGVALSVHAAWLFDVITPARGGLWVTPSLSAFIEL